MSDKIPSAPERDVEWKEEDDFEDLDAVSPGGEPGASVTAVISS